MRHFLQNPTNISSEFLSPKRTGVIILAGGLGTRLGFDGPKGCYPLPSGKTLFDTLLDSCDSLPVAVMCSPHNYEETKKALPGIPIFMQPEANGNGYALKYFIESGIKWDVDSFCVLQVDNPLAKPFAPASDLDVVTFPAEEGEEVGRLYDEDGKLYCCEYIHNPPKYLRYAYSGMFACSLSFAKKVANLSLPGHTVVKKGISKTEYFIFDTFHNATSYQLIEKPRETIFAPIKYEHRNNF